MSAISAFGLFEWYKESAEKQLGYSSFNFKNLQKQRLCNPQCKQCGLCLLALSVETDSKF